MWLDGTIEEALSLKDVICVGWYDEPSCVIDYPEPHEIYFAKEGKLRSRASDIYKINLHKAIEMLKFYGLIHRDVDIKKEIEGYKVIQKELETLEIEYADLVTNSGVWLPVSETSEVFLYIPPLFNQEGEINTDEIKFIEKRFEEVKKYFENFLKMNAKIHEQFMGIER